MKLLFVGDPHVEPHALGDARALGCLVEKTATEHGVDAVVISGDLYHSHGNINADVQLFWFDFFEQIRHECVVIKGNHDGPGEEGSRACALRAHSLQATTVIDGPLVIDKLLFCPYTNAEQLVDWSSQHKDQTILFCHQTFDGSTYENGFYAGDGIDPNLIAQQQIVSGHIHTPQEFGKVWYPGAPRWRTAADANTDRAIWVLDIQNGLLVKRTPIDTSGVCRKIHVLEDVQGQDFSCAIVPHHEYRVVSRGSGEWLEKRAVYFSSWAKWRGVNTDTRAATVKESDGIPQAFGKWLEASTPRRGTPVPVLKNMVKERLQSLAVP